MPRESDAVQPEKYPKGVRDLQPHVASIPGAFHDIGAVVLYLRIISWQIPDFDLAGYDAALRALHAKMQGGTSLKVSSHRFLIIARST
jgi:hypothetical protein